ncbi:MAG: MBL fold metallo-hydrolase [Acidobacteria bacterium]|nr:MBL fold metallo-hydrolase [Acidobacteriota bacterium]
MRHRHDNHHVELLAGEYHHPVSAFALHANPTENPRNLPRSRREFLSMLVGAGIGGMTLLESAYTRAALARAQAPGAPSNLFDIEKVAEGVYAAIARPTALINSNAAIFVNSRDVVVMDTHSKPSAAGSLIAQIRNEVTPKPVRYVVNSHFHWDHMQGNSAYREAFPSVEFVASEATRRLMSEHGTARLKKSLQDLPQTVERLRKSLEKAKTAREREILHQMLREHDMYSREMARFSLELPTVTLENNLVLHDKEHSLVFAFSGRAHTAGDVVIFCPEKRVIATGDMVHGFLPYMGDGYPREWPKTLDVVAKFSFEHIIGGHGPVQHDRVRYTHMRNYIEELAVKVGEGKRAGKTIADLQKMIQLNSIKSLQGDNYLNLVTDTLGRYNPLQPGRQAVEEGIRGNIQDVYNTLERS